MMAGLTEVARLVGDDLRLAPGETVESIPGTAAVYIYGIDRALEHLAPDVEDGMTEELAWGVEHPNPGTYRLAETNNKENL